MTWIASVPRNRSSGAWSEEPAYSGMARPRSVTAVGPRRQPGQRRAGPAAEQPRQPERGAAGAHDQDGGEVHGPRKIAHFRLRHVWSVPRPAAREGTSPIQHYLMGHENAVSRA